MDACTQALCTTSAGPRAVWTTSADCHRALIREHGPVGVFTLLGIFERMAEKAP
jgi:hypothetical protein